MVCGFSNDFDGPCRSLCNTVKHDESAHMAMMDHRNWAWSTAVAMWLVAIWSFWRYYKQKAMTLRS
ncbi:hypothetical protein ACTAZI_01490 [Legionella bozemanae]|uniref:hypothetical protein n=1 Tax=Legionella bozemanae TaxID=447 RepID=UPI003EEEF4A1